MIYIYVKIGGVVQNMLGLICMSRHKLLLRLRVKFQTLGDNGEIYSKRGMAYLITIILLCIYNSYIAVYISSQIYR